MPSYGTKEYYEKEVAKAEVRLSLMTSAIVNHIGYMEGTMNEAAVIATVCEAYVEAYEEFEKAKRRIHEYCTDAIDTKKST